MNSKKILVINGPNLNYLHLRDHKIYGKTSLKTIEKSCLNQADEIKKNKKIDLKIDFFQSNSEGEIVSQIQKAIGKYSAILINAAAYSHYSIAIRDALEIFDGTKIELHLSNTAKREEFRHKSLISSVVDGVISGLGANVYILAIQALSLIFESKK